jgi:SAM-dependent methyltransferase
MMTNQTQATYDRIADRFAEVNAEMPPELIAAADSFLGQLKPGARVLDLGCGAGRDMAWLEGWGAAVVGADLSRGMLAQARCRAQGSVVQMDMRRLAFPRECFWGVWCDASFLHLSKSEAPGVLAEIRRILTPEGVLFLSIQEGTGETWEQQSYGALAPRFFARYRLEEMLTLLENGGFALIKHTSIPGRWRHWLSFLATIDRGEL